VDMADPMWQRSLLVFLTSWFFQQFVLSYSLYKRRIKALYKTNLGRFGRGLAWSGFKILVKFR
jgi:hypothetical protein